eukprot:scaffold143169_cov18-Tisochrysis_lutea.AAC.8
MYEQALYKLGGLVVQGLAALDQSLEAAKLLPKLEATPEAPDVIDPDTGEVKSEFSRTIGGSLAFNVCTSSDQVRSRSFCCRSLSPAYQICVAKEGEIRGARPASACPLLIHPLTHTSDGPTLNNY